MHCMCNNTSMYLVEVVNLKLFVLYIFWNVFCYTDSSSSKSKYYHKMWFPNKFVTTFLNNFFIHTTKIDWENYIWSAVIQIINHIEEKVIYINTILKAMNVNIEDQSKE